ncbi:hypothetical protein [Hyphomonas sp.]|uniref:hypothetical protein n=1 Tax=Hyphomonas sp. TaxID=87 RepID=UPI000C93586C|nr:hypothetical protein [Hyphomonas sp.]MAL46840.1 hypothetical protein [Hyphomonas sp.]|tara:strand:+ start:1485 stop:1910 length:426 start_codon:yes stop_codon:yes gene_type:complete
MTISTKEIKKTVENEAKEINREVKRLQEIKKKKEGSRFSKTEINLLISCKDNAMNCFPGINNDLSNHLELWELILKYKPKEKLNNHIALVRLVYTMGFYEALMEQNTRKHAARMYVRELEAAKTAKEMEENYNWFTENKGI